jgi:hypothetical protein
VSSSSRRSSARYNRMDVQTISIDHPVDPVQVVGSSPSSTLGAMLTPEDVRSKTRDGRLLSAHSGGKHRRASTLPV